MIKYGRDFPPQFTPLHIELWAWRNYDLIKEPAFERWEHLRNCALVLIPGMKVSYNPWFERCCIAYANYSYMAAMGCSNSSKTWSFHTLAFLDYMSDPLHTQVICTTTSQAGLDTRMWPILAGHYRAIRPGGWKLVNNPRKMIMANPDDPKHTIRAVVLEERADKTKIADNIIGAHTDRVIWIVDESTSAPGAVYEAWSNLAGGTLHRRFIMLGNPIDQLDTLGRYCRPETGWDSVNADTDQWNFMHQGEKGVGLHFDGEKSPNLAFPPKADGTSHWNYLFGHQDYKRHSADIHREPLQYWRFCRGWFADATLVPKVMTMTEIDEAGSRNSALAYGETERFASLDPAYGGDRPALKVWSKSVDAVTKKQIMQQLADYEIPLPVNCLPG